MPDPISVHAIASLLVIGFLAGLGWAVAGFVAALITTPVARIIAIVVLVVLAVLLLVHII